MKYKTNFFMITLYTSCIRFYQSKVESELTVIDCIQTEFKVVKYQN